MVELVDTPDLGSGIARCESSSLFRRTILKLKKLFLYINFEFSKEDAYNKYIKTFFEILIWKNKAR